MLDFTCRDASHSSGLSPVPDEEGESSPEGSDPADNAEGTVTWQQASASRNRGQKGKKKKSEGERVFI